MHSLRGRFTLGVIVVTLLLSLIPLLGGHWLAQLDRTLAQVAQQTAPAASLAAQSAHISAQLIAEVRHLTMAQDQYTRQNTHFGITQRATLLLSHIRDLEAATGVTQTSTVMAETAKEILVIVDMLNRDIAQILELLPTDEQAIPLRSSLAVKEQQLSRLSRLLSIHANRIVRDSQSELDASVVASVQLLNSMRWYSLLLIGGVIGFIGVAGYFFLARNLVGKIVHLANIVQDMRDPDLLNQLGRTRISEFAKLEASIVQLHQVLQRLDEQSVALQTLATERELARQEALRQSLIDPLTQVANRRYLFQTWQTLPHQGVEPQDWVAVLMIDLDYFKQINDQYGHAAGDAVLVETATRLKQGVRPSALVARLGGEEFAVILTGADAQMAWHIAERLRQAISAEPCHWSQTTIAVTASIGVAVAIYADTHLDPLLSQADSALYQAKADGRNCVVEYCGD